MDWKLLGSTFTLVFLAELGDKTQLAALTLTATSGRPATVALGAILALASTTVLSVLLGDVLVGRVSPATMQRAAGVLFLVLGGLMVSGRL